MSAPPATALSGVSTDTTAKSRVVIPVEGMYVKGYKYEEGDEGDDGDTNEQTRDGEQQKKCSPPNSAVTGTAVFVDGKFHPDSHFTVKGTSVYPAAPSNCYASFEPTEKGGKIYFAEKDETAYNFVPAIHFHPSRTLNKQEASLLMNFGNGKVQGRNDEGHLVDETIDGKEEAE